MEAVTTMSEVEWCSSFNGMCSEEADFMAQLIGSCSIPNEVPSGNNFAVSSTFWPIHHSNMKGGESVMYSSEETNTSMYSFSQGSSYGTHESYYPGVIPTTNNFMTMDYSNNVTGGDDFLNQDDSNDCTESEKKLSENVLQRENNFHHGDKASKPSEMSKKRPRIPGEKSRRSMKLKKCAKVEDDDEDNNGNSTKNNATNAVFHRSCSSSYCSEDETNASHEMNGTISSSSNLTGKTRASRGSATDPQSLYARKRRERINERLRILQNLVPNGTKVDISTMLEEAVHYVKFLQLQIKLLSSDDLWMYAPIAYNGMDLGLDLNMSAPKSQSQ